MVTDDERSLTSNGSVDVHPTGGQVAGGGCGAVHLMLSVQNEHDVNGSSKLWVGPAGRVHRVETEHMTTRIVIGRDRAGSVNNQIR